MGSAKTPLRVCVVIPAYNEGSVIGDVVAAITKTFKQTPYYTEVVVINDGSKDNTGIVARKHGATVINHILNSGAGGATATGLSYAQQNDFDIAVTMDGDGQHDPNDVVRGVKEIISNNSDLLIGSRLIDSKGMSRVKVLGNKGLSLITFIIFGISSTDSQSGLRIFSREALENLKWQTSGYEFCSEMLWRAKQQGLTINEYPIKAIYTDYSIKKGQNNWNAINIIKSLLKRRIAELLG
ncbi:MAG TPA: glycosyltransferase family 2 protein [Candidatus Saccharibacteria bacterium]|nr:glycosyltransferase family 2 protein [Candidatus Saccharibacteria bacterium]HRQ07121.1 glycosyltransferase family 2 protein [Candidatus Saccharibacteria bacterium]